MNRNETVSLWISIGAALFAAFLIFSYTQEKTQEVTKIYGSNVSAVVALELIHEMATIQENMVDIVDLPEKFVQPGYVKRIEDVVGKAALAPIAKGEQILSNKVILPGPETGLSLQVSPGKRAVTIPINEQRAVGRLLKPGDRVDMLAVIDYSSGSAQKRYIKTLLQDLVILATGMRVVNELPRLSEEVGGVPYIENMRGKTDFSTLTIEASPEDAQKIVYLLSTDPESIFFTLRHPSDNSFRNLKQAQQADFLVGSGAARAPAQARPNLSK